MLNKLKRKLDDWAVVIVRRALGGIIEDFIRREVVSKVVTEMDAHYAETRQKMDVLMITFDEFKAIISGELRRGKLFNEIFKG
jgi:hypothetical protein